VKSEEGKDKSWQPPGRQNDLLLSWNKDGLLSDDETKGKESGKR
jgi:hypothetical protein